MKEMERANLTDKYALKTMPYLKYLTQKSGYTRGKIRAIDDMPENYIDYLLIDIEALRVGELNMFNSEGIYTLEIAILNYEYKISLQYNFLITERLHNKIESRMEYFFGQPEKVKYNLNDTRKFKVIQGGKSNGK